MTETDSIISHSNTTQADLGRTVPNKLGSNINAYRREREEGKTQARNTFPPCS